MQTADLTSPDNIDAVLRILSWCLIAFAALWVTTGLIGYFHRRAYNLTRAESSGSKPIQPDFLTVDKAKRQAAIDRGQAYDAVLEARESAGAPTTIEKVCFWSRFAAMSTAVLGLVATVVGTLTKIDSLQAGINRLSSWDAFSQIVSENKVGAVVAVAVIGASIVSFAEGSKKWGKTKTPRR